MKETATAAQVAPSQMEMDYENDPRTIDKEVKVDEGFVHLKRNAIHGQDISPIKQRWP